MLTDDIIDITFQNASLTVRAYIFARHPYFKWYNQCWSCDHGDVWTCLGLVVRDERGILLIFVDICTRYYPDSENEIGQPWPWHIKYQESLRWIFHETLANYRPCSWISRNKLVTSRIAGNKFFRLRLKAIKKRCRGKLSFRRSWNVAFHGLLNVQDKNTFFRLILV